MNKLLLLLILSSCAPAKAKECRVSQTHGICSCSATENKDEMVFIVTCAEQRTDEDVIREYFVKSRK